jgi:hypothetical protein
MRELPHFSIFIIIVFLICSDGVALAQQLMELKPTKPVICYIDQRNNHDHIHPPKNFVEGRAHEARTQTATFEVEYINFPADNQAKNAFQYAIDIWETQIISSVPIRVRAEWVTLDEGVLGQAIWGTAFANFDGAQHMNTFYPVALAEKIAGKELNPTTEADISAQFNGNVSWYFGTDANAPSGKMDLVTVVLHELAHGLIFTDTYTVENNSGSLGLQSGAASIPFVLDLFVENGINENLFATFTSPSTALGTQLTSQNIFIDAQQARAANGGNAVKLYAPSPFNQGSSISHFDETTFNNTANKLMTPQIAFAEAIHNPGIILLGLMSDLGWVSTRIDHVPLKDTERKNGAPYIIKTKIISDNSYNTSSVKLHYTTNSTSFTEVTMTPTGIVNEYQASLPGTTNSMTYGYYISVQDVLNRTFTNPGKRQIPKAQSVQEFIAFTIGTDTESPVITHEPLENIFKDDTHLTLQAVVVDNLGIATVSVEYLINNVAQLSVSMNPESSTDKYKVAISLPSNLAIGDKITYRIIAKDNSANKNQKIDPLLGYHTVFVTGIKPVQKWYVNNFNAASNDFIGNGFRITTPAGFKDGAIHSTHPYADGSGPASESNYIYQLQVPIQIEEEIPLIKFNEIVLVEPGEIGSSFGDDDFYDYVVVEGSRDFGVTWKEFADGYDARAQNSWLSAWTSSLNNKNAQATGDPAMYRERTIDMLTNNFFKPGDEVLIRFRLLADASSFGWGWAIDNLHIQTLVTDVEQAPASAIQVYPTRATKTLTVEVSPQYHPGKGQVKIINLQGQSLYAEGVDDLFSYKKEIDIDSFAEGLYLLHFQANGKSVVKRFIKVK